MIKKLTGKRDYHAEYLQRKTRGHHPGEKIQYPKRQGVGKVVKAIKKKEKKQAWNTAYYSSPLKSPNAKHIYFTMSSYDYMRTSFANYHRKRQKALFKIHKGMEEWVETWQNLYAEPQIFEELKFENDSEPGDELEKVNEIRVDRKRFEWVLYDLRENPPVVLYFLQYQQGQIRRAKLPESFDRVSFVISIKSWNLWE